VAYLVPEINHKNFASVYVHSLIIHKPESTSRERPVGVAVCIVRAGRRHAYGR